VKLKWVDCPDLFVLAALICTPPGCRYAGYEVGPIIQDMRDSLERERDAEKKMGWDMIIFPTPAIRRMLMVGVGIAIAQQAVGIDAIQYFLLYIIEESGIKSRAGQTGILIFLGLLKLIFIVIGGKLFDRRGRRPLLFMSLCGMAAALMLLSINFFGTYHHSAFAIFGLAMYLSFLSLGMGPGAWLIPSEVFATCIRAKAMGVATFLNRLVATLMASSFLTVANGMSWAAFFFMLSMICLVCLIYLHLYLPETNGRSLEDMSVYFAEITGDTSVLEADAKLIREREAREHAARTERKFEPLNLSSARSSIPPESLKEARVTGTMC
jgi:MFS family permease